MSTTFANSINSNPIYADRAEHDAAGNDLQTTYATKAELPEFSQAEQDAMDSGINSTKVGNYDNHLADTTIHVTSADKTAWNAKEDASNKKQSIDASSTTEFPSSKATADFVNSSVATATANFLGNYTLTDLGLTYPATDAQIETALDGYTFSPAPTNNDYVYVEIQNPQTTGIDDSVERFKFNGTQWLYEYTLNNSSFTSAEKAAIDSGITSSDVSAYNTHIADTDIHVTTSDKSTWNGKQDAINDLSSIRSGAQAGSTAVQPGDLATVAVSGDYDDLLNKPVIPTVPVQDVTVDGTSVLNAQGVAEITMPTFTQAQANWTEADNQSVQYIQNKPTLAAVATSGAYSDLSGTPTINNVPAVTSSDDNKVLKASYSGGVGSYSWEAESGGTVTDVEVDGTSVVSGGVASITMPTELVPAVGSGDNAKVLTAAYDSDTGTGSYSWKVPEGLFIARYGTSTYAEVDAAARAGKIVYCYVNGRFAFLAYTNTTGGSDYNYEFQYYRSAASGKDSVFIYKVRPAGSIYGPEWETTQRDVKAGNISYPVTNVKVNGSSVMSGTVAEITLPTIPVTDVEVDGTSVVNASGVAEITMPTELVPTVTSSDDGKVLKAAYSGGTGSYSWETESGGGGADWDAQSGEPGYIENKPVPKTLVAGTGITVTENSTQLVVASTNQLYSAGNGLTLNNATFAVDTSVVATQNDLSGYATLNDIPAVDQTYDGTSANAQSGVAVASGISDAVAALPTNLSSAQIQALKEALGVDETVLWEGSTTSPTGDNKLSLSITFPETVANFEYLKIFYWYRTATNAAWKVDMCYVNGGGFHFTCQWPESASGNWFMYRLYGSGTSASGDGGYKAAGSVNTFGSYGGGMWGNGTIWKVVGVHRIASN